MTEINDVGYIKKDISLTNNMTIVKLLVKPDIFLGTGHIP